MGGCALTEVIVPLAQVVVGPEEDDDLGWQDRALCAQTDPEAFFPEKGGSTREARCARRASPRDVAPETGPATLSACGLPCSRAA